VSVTCDETGNNLGDVVIKSPVTSIGDNAFLGCLGVKVFGFFAKSSNVTFGQHVFDRLNNSITAYVLEDCKFASILQEYGMSISYGKKRYNRRMNRLRKLLAKRLNSH
jgi:hypothetical protein